MAESELWRRLAEHPSSKIADLKEALAATAAGANPTTRSRVATPERAAAAGTAGRSQQARGGPDHRRTLSEMSWISGTPGHLARNGRRSYLPGDSVRWLYVG